MDYGAQERNGIVPAIYTFHISSPSTSDLEIGLVATLESNVSMSVFAGVAVLHTSKKPLMKLLGNLALGSSSARKYLSTCDVCFQ